MQNVLESNRERKKKEMEINHFSVGQVKCYSIHLLLRKRLLFLELIKEELVF